MNSGVSIIVFVDGGIRLKRDASSEEHDTALARYTEHVFTHVFSPSEDPPTVVLDIQPD